MDYKVILLLMLVTQACGEIPDPYYHPEPCDPTLLNLIFAIPDELPPYQEDVWDCSNMAAYLEWLLENKGFNTSIVLSIYFPGLGPDECHAWVAVDLPNERVYIEPTLVDGGYPPIIRARDKEYEYYNRYEIELVDIYDVMDLMDEGQYEWWTRMSAAHRQIYAKPASPSMGLIL